MAAQQTHVNVHSQQLAQAVHIHTEPKFPVNERQQQHCAVPWSVDKT